MCHVDEFATETGVVRLLQRWSERDQGRVPTTGKSLTWTISRLFGEVPERFSIGENRP